MNFGQAVEIILRIEGGYSDDPRDPGGETNFGISKRAYPQLDIKNLTAEKAKAIYRRDYWDAIQCDTLHPDIRLLAFDCAVNQGMSFAKKVVQLAGDSVQVYALARHKRYSANKNFAVYGSNWTRRLLEVALLTRG